MACRTRWLLIYPHVASSLKITMCCLSSLHSITTWQSSWVAGLHPDKRSNDSASHHGIINDAFYLNWALYITKGQWRIRQEWYGERNTFASKERVLRVCANEVEWRGCKEVDNDSLIRSFTKFGFKPSVGPVWNMQKLVNKITKPLLITDQQFD